MNKKAVIALVSYSVLIGGVLVSQVGNVRDSIFSNFIQHNAMLGASAVRSITIDQNNVSESDFTGDQLYKDFYGNGFGIFSFDRATYLKDGVCTLAKNGEINKISAANGLTAVKAKFSSESGKLVVYCSDDGQADHYTMRYELEDDVSMPVRGNYIKFVAEGDDVEITKIQLSFACDTATPEHQHVYINSKWEYDSTNHWHHCSNEHCTVLKDYEEHDIVEFDSDVEPTYYNTGHTAGRACSVCGMAEGGGAYIIPKLGEENYIRSTEFHSSSRSVTETWTMKDPSSIGKTSYSVSNDFDSYIGVKDYSSGSEVSTDHTPYSFTTEYKDKGINVYYDSDTNTTFFDITNPDGVVFDQTSITFGSLQANTVVITGGPLTIKAPNGYNKEALSMWCSTMPASMATLIIDNDTTIIYPSENTSPSTSAGLNESILTINEGASLRISGFKTGISSAYTPITVNGTLDVSGTQSALYGTSTSNIRTLNVANNRDLYADHNFMQTGGSVTYKQNEGYGAYKHVMVIPTGSNINKYISFSSEITKMPTASSTGTLSSVCSGCGHSAGDITLPVLSAANYDIDGDLKEIGGKWYDTATYTWKIHDYGDIVINNKDVEITRYIKVGDKVHSVRTWNDTYTGSVASESGNNLTITVNGDVDIVGTLDLTKYDQVTIAGNGTLNVITNSESGMLAKNLIIDSGVTVVLDGTSYGTSNSMNAIKTTSSLTINGDLSIENFYNGINPVGTCVVNGSVSMDNVVRGVYASGALRFTSYGNIDINVVSSNGIGFFEGGSSSNIVEFHFTENSITNIVSSYEGFGTGSNTGAGYQYTLRISGNAEVNVKYSSSASSNYHAAVSNVTNFIVENEDGSKCNAKVYLEATGGDGLSFLYNSTLTYTLTVNSTETLVIKRASASKNKSGISFSRSKFNVNISSPVEIEGFTNAVYIGNNSCVFDQVNCNHMITVVNCTNNKGKGSGAVYPTDIDNWF